MRPRVAGSNDDTDELIPRAKTKKAVLEAKEAEKADAAAAPPEPAPAAGRSGTRTCDRHDTTGFVGQTFDRLFPAPEQVRTTCIDVLVSVRSLFGLLVALPAAAQKKSRVVTISEVTIVGRVHEAHCRGGRGPHPAQAHAGRASAAVPGSHREGHLQGSVLTVDSDRRALGNDSGALVPRVFDLGGEVEAKVKKPRSDVTARRCRSLGHRARWARAARRDVDRAAPDPWRGADFARNRDRDGPARALGRAHVRTRAWPPPAMSCFVLGAVGAGVAGHFGRLAKRVGLDSAKSGTPAGDVRDM